MHALLLDYHRSQVPTSQLFVYGVSLSREGHAPTPQKTVMHASSRPNSRCCPQRARLCTAPHHVTYHTAHLRVKASEIATDDVCAAHHILSGSVPLSLEAHAPSPQKAVVHASSRPNSRCRTRRTHAHTTAYHDTYHTAHHLAHRHQR